MKFSRKELPTVSKKKKNIYIYIYISVGVFGPHARSNPSKCKKSGNSCHQYFLILPSSLCKILCNNALFCICLLYCSFIVSWLTSKLYVYFSSCLFRQYFYQLYFMKNVHISTKLSFSVSPDFRFC